MLYDIMDVMQNTDDVLINKHDRLLLNVLIWYTEHNIEHVISDGMGTTVIRLPLD